MRFSIGKFFAWILVALLLVGLLGFGITDVLVGRNNNIVASVGGSKISSQQFIRRFQQDLNYYSQKFGKELSIEDAKVIGIPQMTLSKLINSQSIENKLNKMGVSRGNLAVSEAITNTKSFHDLSGNFSKDIYLSSLKRAGIELDEYESSVRNELSSSILLRLASSSNSTTDVVTDLLAGFMLEKRTGKFISLDLSKEKEKFIFDDEALMDYFMSNKEEFRVPETSVISYISLNFEDLFDKIDVTDVEISNFYNDNIETITQEASFNLDRLIYSSETAALESLKKITLGESSFAMEGKQKALTSDDYNLGFLRKNQIENAARSQVLNALEGDIIGPIKNGLGFAIYRVNSIQPEFDPTLEDLREEITDRLKREKSFDKMDGIADIANEEIAAGANYNDLKSIAPFNEKRLNYNSGSSLPDFFKNSEFEEILNSINKYPSDMIKLPNGSIISAKLDEVLQSRIPAFDTVKDDISEILALRQVDLGLSERARMIEDSILKGIFPLPSDKDLKVENFEYIDRSYKSPTFTAEIIKSVFDLKNDKGQNDIAFSTTVNNGVLKILLLTEILEYNKNNIETEEVTSAIKDAMNNQINNDIFGYFIASLRDNAEIKINTSAVDSVLSRFQK